MPDVLEASMQTVWFWLSLACDFLIQFSLVFAFVYAFALLLASFISPRYKLVPNALCIPGLLLAAILLVWGQPGRHLAFTLYICLYKGLVSLGVQEWFATAITAVWAGVAALGCLRLLFGLVALRGYVRELPEADADPVFQHAMDAVQPGCPVRVKYGGKGGVVSSRARHGVILVPDGFSVTYSDRERFLIYTHELTHIKRHDTWKHWLAELAKAFLWFNPVAVHAAKRYLCHLEIACDRRVLGVRGTDPHTYATLMTRTSAQEALLLTSFSSGYRELARRMRYIFYDARFLAPGRDRLVSLLCAAAFGGLFLLSSVWLPDPSFALPPESPHTFTDPDGVTFMTRPDGSGTIITPDGTMLSITPTFQWQGILGQHMAASIEAPPPAR